MRTRLFLVAFAAVVVSAAAAQAQAVNPNDIRERYDAYNAAFSTADSEAVVAFYADNAIRVDSDGSVMDGTAAIRDEISTFFGDNDYVLDEVIAPDIQASGDLAVTLSVFREHWTPKAGGEMTHQVGQCSSSGSVSPTETG